MGPLPKRIPEAGGACTWRDRSPAAARQARSAATVRAATPSRAHAGPHAPNCPPVVAGSGRAKGEADRDGASTSTAQARAHNSPGRLAEGVCTSPRQERGRPVRRQAAYGLKRRRRPVSAWHEPRGCAADAAPASVRRTNAASAARRGSTAFDGENGVLVVGSGPAGAMAALHLVESGVPVTMLESGSNHSAGCRCAPWAEICSAGGHRCESRRPTPPPAIRPPAGIKSWRPAA